MSHIKGQSTEWTRMAFSKVHTSTNSPSLYSLIDTIDPHIVSWEIKKNFKKAPSGNVKECKKKILGSSFYLESHQKLMLSVLGQDSSSIQVSWKSGQ